MPDDNPLDPQQRLAKRSMLGDALKTFLYSLSQGMAASAQAPGRRGSRLGAAAALGAPFQLQQMEEQQRAQEQDRIMRVQQLRAQILGGEQDRAMRMAEQLQGRVQGQQIQVPRPEATPSPIGGIQGEPSFGGQGTVETPFGAPVNVPGMGQIPIMSAGGRAQQEAEKRMAALDEFQNQQRITTDENIRQAKATTQPPAPMIREVRGGLMQIGPTGAQFIPGAEPPPAQASDLPAIAKEYQFAVTQGYKGTFEQYQNEDANRKKPSNTFNIRDSVSYEDLDAKAKARVNSVRDKVAAGEYTISQGLSALGGVRGGLGGALTEALEDVRVLPTAVRQANSDIERAKNVMAPIRQLVEEINKAKSLEEKIVKSARLETYVQAIGTQFARARGERGVVTDKDVSRVLGLVPGWKSANFAPGFADENLKLIDETFTRDQSALLSKYFTTVDKQGGTAAPGGSPKPTMRFNPSTGKLEPIKP